MVEFVIIIPVIAGLLSCLIKPSTGRLLLPVTGIFHFVATLACITGFFSPLFSHYILPGSEGLLVLGITSFLFLVISFYTVPYLKKEALQNEKLYIASTLFFIAAMSSVSIADNLALFWISVEATTLVSAPLIYIHVTRTALEATWKYILICSVGIALALMGTFLFAISRDMSGLDLPLTFTALIKNAHALDPGWLKYGFIFILIGYGTKMGLAPMHTWLPDAHSEAPSPSSALLSGALLNTAFLGIFKINKILANAGLESFSGNILVVLGLLSVFIAAVFIYRQRDYKRMLAYSSIENMGIIAFGTGIGGFAVYGALLHLVHHALIKSSLFLSSGNILIAYKTKLIEKTGSLTKFLPKTGVAFAAGFLAIAGLPPFGLFFSEFFIISGAIQKGAYIPAGLFLLALFLVIAGMTKHVITILFRPCEDEPEVFEPGAMVYPQYIFLIMSIVLCLIQYSPFNTLLSQAVALTRGAL